MAGRCCVIGENAYMPSAPISRMSVGRRELALIVVPECEREGSQARTAMLIDRLDRLVSESGIATRLRDYGIDIAEAPTLAREAMKQTRLLVNNPCEITEADAQRLYEAAW